MTSSKFKIEENLKFCNLFKINDKPIKDLIKFNFNSLAIKETLEPDLKLMVTNEVLQAYLKVKVPCIVEHAGLIFREKEDQNYPGGLTKAMWNTLGEDFSELTGMAGKPVIARAVIAYCDGHRIHTFTGETLGTLSPTPKGDRSFYWDTVFIPDDPLDTELQGKTYSEIVESRGVEYKIEKLSQSSKAMKKFCEHFLLEETDFW